MENSVKDIHEWWCGPLNACKKMVPSSSFCIDSCLETTLIISPLWKVCIIFYGVYMARGVRAQGNGSKRSVGEMIAVCVCVLNAVCGCLYLGGHSILYPCRVYAGVLWIVESLHSALLFAFLPVLIPRFRGLMTLDFLTRLIAIFTTSNHLHEAHKIGLIDISILVDSGLMLLKCGLLWMAMPNARNHLPDRMLNLEANASFLSRFVFIWIWPLLRKGYANKALFMDDLPPLQPCDSVELLFVKFCDRWKLYPQHSLKRHLHAICWSTFYHSALLMAIATIANISSPFLLHMLLDSLEISNPHSGNAFGLATLWFLALTINSVCVHQFWSVAVRCGMHTRSILQQFVIAKSLRLSTEAKQKYSAGNIHSLLSVDACRLCDNYVICFLHWNTWSAVITLGTCIYFLFQLLSYSSFVWLIIMVLYLPCGVFFGSKMSKNSQAHQSLRDERTSILTQILRGVVTMKASSYESWSENRLCDARAQELRKLKHKALNETFSKGLLLVAQVLAPIISFVVYIHIQHQKLNAAKAFAALAWFNTASGPLLRLPQALVTLIDASVSLSRLEEFFRASEHLGNSSDINSGLNHPTHLYHAIEMKNVDSSWSPQRTIFKNLSIAIPKGQFVACCGAVGSGKSSFLELCLRLPFISNGSVQLHGLAAYCPQRPWIQNASIRENILFGLPMDRMWYKMTLHMCALEDDLAAWPSGDATLAGDQGCALSGGQKQRISLARAIYSRREILLLDDIFASLDSNVGQHIFQRCLCSPALAYTTKILVVNQPSYLQHPSIERVLFFQSSSDGCIIEMIDPTQLPVHALENALPDTTLAQFSSVSPKQEISGQGALDIKLVRMYISSLGSTCSVTSYSVLILMEHLLILACTYCLSKWCEEMHDAYQLLYFGLGIAVVVVSLGHRVFFVLLSISASWKLHQSLAHALMFASMYFFDTQDQGVLLNRCIKDIAALDEAIPYVVSTFLYNSLEILMSIISMAYATPYVLIFVVVSIFPYYVIYNMYRWPARDLKRLQSVSRSPILSYFNEISQGTSTIIAFDASQDVLSKCREFINDSVRAYWPSLIANQWVTVWLELLGVFIVAITALACVWFHSHGKLNPAMIGLVLTYASQLPSHIGWVLKMLAAIEVDFVALERIDQIITTASFHTDHRQLLLPPKPHNIELPIDGILHIKHMSMKYNSTTILRDIHVDIPSKAKLAVVGRTGAGKTSFVRALLRLYPIEGSICLGDIDMASFSTDFLRRQVVGFVPQDSLLLGNTLWDALVADDTSVTLPEVNAILERVGMKNVIDRLKMGLDTPISEVTLSGGQMQLFCIARALLRPGSILICDEATAFMDTETDEAIHKLLFQLPRTVISICHRGDRMMDYEYVLVLDKGRLVEFGPPQEVLTNYPKGVFANLVSQ